MPSQKAVSAYFTSQKNTPSWLCRARVAGGVIPKWHTNALISDARYRCCGRFWCSGVQSRNAVSAFFTSKQIPPFGFAYQSFFKAVTAGLVTADDTPIPSPSCPISFWFAPRHLWVRTSTRLRGGCALLSAARPYAQIILIDLAPHAREDCQNSGLNNTFCWRIARDCNNS